MSLSGNEAEAQPRRLPDHRRTGLLVVRVWREGDPDEGGLRARITHTQDVAEGAEVVTAAATTEEIYVVIRDWLEAYVAT